MPDSAATDASATTAEASATAHGDERGQTGVDAGPRGTGNVDWKMVAGLVERRQEEASQTRSREGCVAAVESDRSNISPRAEVTCDGGELGAGCGWRGGGGRLREGGERNRYNGADVGQGSQSDNARGSTSRGLEVTTVASVTTYGARGKETDGTSVKGGLRGTGRRRHESDAGSVEQRQKEAGLGRSREGCVAAADIDRSSGVAAETAPVFVPFPSSPLLPRSLLSLSSLHNLHHSSLPSFLSFFLLIFFSSLSLTRVFTIAWGLPGDSIPP
jgi:hypothetical protein